MKFIIFSLLLTAVYSWDDLVDNLRFLIYRRRHRKSQFIWGDSERDSFVTTILLIFGIPLTLIYFLDGPGPLSIKLAVMSVALVGLSLLSMGIKIFNARARNINNYGGWEKVGAIGFAVAGLVYPTFRMYYRHARSAPELMAKLALYLSLPAIAGWLITLAMPNAVDTQEILPNLDTLTTFFVGSLMILNVIEFFERYYILYRVNLLAYCRVLLGIALICLLTLDLF
jgi:hypothetical protein